MLALAALLVGATAACGDDAGAPSQQAAAGAASGAPAAGAGGNGSVNAAGSGGVASPSFKKDVAPIFESHCVSCHHTGSVVEPDLHDPFDPTHGPIDAPNTWHDAHGSPYEWLIKPGDPDASFLIYKVSADPDTFDVAVNGNPMPWHVPRMSETELADITQWITDGAHDDAQYAQKVAPLFGTALTLGRKSGRCTFCHYGGSPTGLDILAVFDPSSGLVGAKSRLSGKPRVSPGDPAQSFLLDKLSGAQGAGQQMPLYYPRLTTAEVNILRAWITDGAPNN